MSKIAINLTKEEKDEFAKLPKEEQEAFIEAAWNQRQNIMIKTIGLSMLLIESFDKLKEFGLQRHKLKQYGNMYNKELEKYINEVYDQELPGESTDYIAELSKKIDELL
jgi:hypothetical protein